MNLFILGSWNWLWETINGLFLVICNLIYSLISWLYQVFDAVAKVNLFSEETFDEITSRIYVVMGIAMLFVFAYNIILMIINPDDKKTTGNTGKLVKETIISLVLIILLPTIFNYMYIFQNNILDSQIIGKIILGTNISNDDEVSNCDPKDYDCTCDFSGYGLENYVLDDNWFFDDISDVTAELTNKCKNFKTGADMTDSKRGAYAIAPILMSAFYKPTNFTFDDCVSYLQGDSSKITDADEQRVCVNYFYDVTASKYSGNISPFVMDNYLRIIVSDSSKNLMEFNWLLAIVAGVLAVYMFFCYAMEIGVRVAKLGVLQIFSPIAVMMRIIPGKKEAMFDKWLQQLKNTYLDVFIRLMIIYFALFAISLVPGVIDQLFASFASSDAGFFVKGLSLVFVILGILKFAGDAPGLLKEFFGSSGQFALKSPSKQLSENKLGGAALGAIGGAASGAIGNAFNAGRKIKDAKGGKKIGAIAKAPFAPFSGAVGGAFRGMKGGYGAGSFKELGSKIAEAKYGTDAAYERGLGGAIKHRARKVGDGIGSFRDFITGSGASDYKLQAIQASLGAKDKITTQFSNKGIEQILEAFTKMMTDFRQEKDIKFDGKEYTRTASGWVNKNDSSESYSDGEMKDKIKDHFDNLKRSAYVEEFSKNQKAFERLTSQMIDTLNDNLPKIGNDIIKGINENLGTQFGSSDELTEKIGDLLKQNTDEARREIYNISEALDKNLKAAQKEAIVAQQEKKDK